MAADEFRLFMFLVRFLFIYLSVDIADVFSDGRVRDKLMVINAMSVDPLYLQHKHAEKATDLRVRNDNKLWTF